MDSCKKEMMKLWQQHCVLCNRNKTVKSMLVFCFSHNTKANPTGHTKNNINNSEVSGRPWASAGLDHCGYSRAVSSASQCRGERGSSQRNWWGFQLHSQGKSNCDWFGPREKELCNGLFISFLLFFLLLLLMLWKAHIIEVILAWLDLIRNLAWTDIKKWVIFIFSNLKTNRYCNMTENVPWRLKG